MRRKGSKANSPYPIYPKGRGFLVIDNCEIVIPEGVHIHVEGMSNSRFTNNIITGGGEPGKVLIRGKP